MSALKNVQIQTVKFIVLVLKTYHPFCDKITEIQNHSK